MALIGGPHQRERPDLIILVITSQLRITLAFGGPSAARQDYPYLTHLILVAAWNGYSDPDYGEI